MTGLRTIELTDDDAAIIVAVLRVDAARLRRNAPEPSYVGSLRSRVYAETMGEAVKRDRLATSIEEGAWWD